MIRASIRGGDVQWRVAMILGLSIDISASPNKQVHDGTASLSRYQVKRSGSPRGLRIDIRSFLQEQVHHFLIIVLDRDMYRRQPSLRITS